MSCWAKPWEAKAGPGSGDAQAKLAPNLPEQLVHRERERERENQGRGTASKAVTGAEGITGKPKNIAKGPQREGGSLQVLGDRAESSPGQISTKLSN